MGTLSIYCGVNVMVDGVVIIVRMLFVLIRLNRRFDEFVGCILSDVG